MEEGIGLIEGIGEGIGGKLMVAWLPILGYGSMFFGSAVASTLDVLNFVHQKNMEYARMKENERYWEDYYENTGVRNLYPLRDGSYQDYVGSALTASQGVLNLYERNKGRYRR